MTRTALFGMWFLRVKSPSMDRIPTLKDVVRGRMSPSMALKAAGRLMTKTVVETVSAQEGRKQ